ncbi:MAG: hypothetical protein IK092_00025, partial [Muribaculaceae bacterium]|nr:hypothetical protein [Muribaculaceae bacterium]
MSASVVIKNVKTRPADYMRCVLMRFMARYGIFFALPVAICLVLGVVNINFVIVALMLTFVAAPMVLTIVYINYGLTAESRWSVLEKDIEITDEGINLTFTDE